MYETIMHEFESCRQCLFYHFIIWARVSKQRITKNNKLLIFLKRLFGAYLTEK